MHPEQRCRQRVRFHAPVKIDLQDGTRLLGESHDFSEQGIYVYLAVEDRTLLYLQQPVLVQYQNLSHPTPSVPGKVARIDDEGVAIELSFGD